jgi:hypothetical protein
LRRGSDQRVHRSPATRVTPTVDIPALNLSPAVAQLLTTRERRPSQAVQRKVRGPVSPKRLEGRALVGRILAVTELWVWLAGPFSGTISSALRSRVGQNSGKTRGSKSAPEAIMSQRQDEFVGGDE